MKLFFLFSLLLSISAYADDAPAPTPTVTLQNHVFTPSELHIPANQKFELTVKNLDPTPEEFESPGLKIEKVIAGNGQVVIRILPTNAGRYTFVGEYHENTARGVAVVK